jgi:hypothetical protein
MTKFPFFHKTLKNEKMKKWHTTNIQYYGVEYPFQHIITRHLLLSKEHGYDLQPILGSLGQCLLTKINLSKFSDCK